MTPQEQIKAIEDAMKTIIENTTFSFPIKDVLVGPKERSSKFKPPLVWIFADNSVIDLEGSSNEMWRLRYVIVSVVQSYDVQEGKEQAETTVLEATDELLKNRNLGGAGDVIRTGWIPADDRIQNEDSLFGAGVEMLIWFEHCIRV